MNGRIRVYAQRVFARQAVEVALIHEIDGKRFAVSNPMFTEIVPEGNIVEPTFRLHNEEAQELMDALWDAGLRPTEGSGSAGSLAATERHLADMREIVKKKGLM